MSQANAIINVDINTSGAAASLRKLQTQINSFQSALNKNNVQQAASARDYSNQLSNLVNSSQFFSAETVRMRTSAGQLDETLSKGKGSVAQYFNSFRKGSAQAAQVMSLANARAAALQTQFVATGAAAGGYRESLAIRPLQAFNAASTVSGQKLAIQRAMLTQASTHMINFGKNTQWAGRQLMVGFTVPLSIFGALAGKTFMELEKQAISFKKVYGDSFTTPEELEENMKAVSKLSVEYTKYGIAASKTMELAAQAAAMGAQGATLTDAITESTKLATLGQMEQTKALETTIALQNAFGLSGEKLAKSVNFLNMVENQTVVTLQDLAEAIPRVAPVIKGLGGSVEDMAAMIAAMKEGGVSAAQGANALKSGLASLINPSNKASESLKKVGIDINQIVNSNRGDLMGTVQDFGKALSSLDKLGQQQALEKVFGKYQYARLGALFSNIIKDGTQASRVLEMTTLSAQQLQATADKELKVITDSPATKFTAALEKLKVSIAPIGEMFIKLATPIVSFISKIAEGFNNLPDFAKKFLALGTVLIGVVIPAGTMFLGLLMNLGGTLVKFTHIIGVALKGLTTGGLSGAVRAVSESLKYMSLAEMDTSVASQQLAQSSGMVTKALLAQVPSATQATAAISALGREYATLAIRMREASTLGGVPFVVPGAAFDQAGRVSPQTPRVSRRLRRNMGGGIPYLNDGSNSTVPGMGNTDTVPAMLTPGEFVVNKKATSANLPLLHAINSRAPGFNSGGQIPGMQYFGFRNRQRSVQPMDDIDVPMESFFASAREAMAKKVQVQSSSKSSSLYDKLLAKYPEGTNSKVDAIRTAVALGIPVESLNLKSRGNFAFRMSDRANQEMMLGKLTRNNLLNELGFEGAYVPLERQMRSYFGPTFTLDRDIFNRIYREEIAKLPEIGINNRRFEKASRNSLTRYMIETGVPRDQRKNFIRDILQQDSVSSNLSKTELLRTLDMQGIPYRESGKDVYATVDGKEIKLGHLLGREIADLGRPKGIRPFAGAGSNIESPAGYANVHASLGGLLGRLGRLLRLRSQQRVVQPIPLKISKSALELLKNQGILGGTRTRSTKTGSKAARKVRAEAGAPSPVAEIKKQLFPKRVGSFGMDEKSLLDEIKRIAGLTETEKTVLESIKARTIAAAHIEKETRMGGEGIEEKVWKAKNTRFTSSLENDALNDIFGSWQRSEEERPGIGSAALLKRTAPSDVDSSIIADILNGRHPSSPEEYKVLSSWMKKIMASTKEFDGLSPSNRAKVKLLAAFSDIRLGKETILRLKDPQGVFTGNVQTLEDIIEQSGISKNKGGMIPGVPGLLKGALFLGMPHPFKSLTRSNEIKETLARTNILAQSGRSLDFPLMQTGSRVSGLGGHSSNIPGNGIYDMKDGRYVLKFHDTLESTLTEAAASSLTRNVFDLESPQQEVIRVPHPDTGDLVFAVRSKYDEAFAQTTGSFEKESFSKQLIASLIRRDSDLSAENVYGNKVADVGAAIFGMDGSGKPRASMPRIIGEDPISVLEQLDINMLMKSGGGAKKHFAESTADIARSMTESEYVSSMKATISRARLNAEEAVSYLPGMSQLEKAIYLKTLNNDFDNLDTVDWAEVYKHHIGIYPATKRPPTPASLKKKEEERVLRARQAGHNSPMINGMSFVNGGGMIPGIQQLMAGARVKAKAPIKLPVEPPSESTHSWEASGSDPAWDLSPAVSYFLRKNVKPTKSSSAEIKFLQKRGIDTNAMEMEGLADRWNPKNGTAKDILDTQYELNMEEGVPLITQALQRGATDDEMVASILAAQSWHTYPQEELSKVVSRLSSSQLYDLSRGLTTLPENHQLRSLIDGMLPEVKALMREASTAYSDPELGKAFFALASMKNQGGMIPGMQYAIGGVVNQDRPFYGKYDQRTKALYSEWVGAQSSKIAAIKTGVGSDPAMAMAYGKGFRRSKEAMDLERSLFIRNNDLPKIGDEIELGNLSSFAAGGKDTVKFLHNSDLQKNAEFKGNQLLRQAQKSLWEAAKRRRRILAGKIIPADRSYNMPYMKPGDVPGPRQGVQGLLDDLDWQIKTNRASVKEYKAVIRDYEDHAPVIYKMHTPKGTPMANIDDIVSAENQTLWSGAGKSMAQVSEGERILHQAKASVIGISTRKLSNGREATVIELRLNPSSAQYPQFRAAGGAIFESGPSKKIVPGVGSTDTVPAMLTPGEFVINKKATSANMQLLRAINNGTLRGYQTGAPVIGFDENGNKITNPRTARKRMSLGLPIYANIGDANPMNSVQVDTAIAGRGTPTRQRTPSMGRGMAFSMGMGTIGSAMMMAPMIPGIGENAGLSNALSIGGTALSAASIIPALAPMLTGLGAIAIPAAIVVGALGAVGAGLYIWRKNVDDSAKAAADMASNVGVTANALGNMAKMMGQQTPAMRSMQLQLGVSKDEQEIMQSQEFQSIFSSEEGGKFIEELTNSTSAERFKKLSDYLKAAIASGLMDEKQASAFGKVVAAQVGDVVLGTSVSSAIRGQKTGSSALLALAEERKSASGLKEITGPISNEEAGKAIGGSIQVIQDFANASALSKEEYAKGTITFDQMQAVIKESTDVQAQYTRIIQDAMKYTSDFGGTMQATKDQLIKSGLLTEESYANLEASATKTVETRTGGYGGGARATAQVLDKELLGAAASAVASGMNDIKASEIAKKIGSEPKSAESIAYNSIVKEQGARQAFELAGATGQLNTGEDGLLAGSGFTRPELPRVQAKLASFAQGGGSPAEFNAFIGGMSSKNKRTMTTSLMGLNQRDTQAMITDSQSLTGSIGSTMSERVQMSNSYKASLGADKSQGITKAFANAKDEKGPQISDIVLNYAITTTTNGKAGELETEVNKLTKATEDILTLPEDLIIGLGINIDSPQDLAEYGSQVEAFKENYDLLATLDPEIDISLFAKFLVQDGKGNPLSGVQTVENVKLLNKAFKGLKSKNVKTRLNAITTIISKVQDENGNSLGDKAGQAFQQKLIDKFGKGKISKVDGGTIQYVTNLETEINGIDERIAKLLLLQYGLKPADLSANQAEIDRLEALRGGKVASQSNAIDLSASNNKSTGSGGGGGEKSIPQQLKEQAKTSQEMFSKISKLQNAEGFKKFIAGPFAPEFLEYLRSQGAAGLKIIKQGLSKVREAYKDYMKSRVADAAAMAALTPGTIMQESKKVALSGQYNKKLAKAGNSQEDIDAIRQYVSDEDLLIAENLKRKKKKGTINDQEKKQLAELNQEKKSAQKLAPGVVQQAKYDDSIVQMTTESKKLGDQMAFISSGKSPELAAAMVEAGLDINSTSVELTNFISKAKEMNALQFNLEMTSEIATLNDQIELMNHGVGPELAASLAQSGIKWGDGAEAIKRYTATYEELERKRIAALGAEGIKKELAGIGIEINDIKRQIDEANKIAPLQKELKILQDQNDASSRAIELKQRELEPLDEQIKKLQELSDKNSEVYDNQIEALDKIYEREAQIDKLKQGQLNVAQALSRGDVAGAAQAAMAASQDIAERSRQEARSALEAKKEADKKNIEDQILAIQNQRTVIEDKIKSMQLAQRVIQDQIFDKQFLINVETDKLDDLYNNSTAALVLLNIQLDEALKKQKALNDEMKNASEGSTKTSSSLGSSTTPGTDSMNALDFRPDLNGDAWTAAVQATPGWQILNNPPPPYQETPLPTTEQGWIDALSGLNLSSMFNNGGKINKYAMGGMMEGYNTGGNIGYRGSKEPPPVMMNYGGAIKKYIHGSIVPGVGMSDKVPAMLTPGEFIIRKSVSETYGPMLSALNSQVFPKMNLNSSIPTLGDKNDDGSVYNYQISVSLNGSNLDPNDVANAVMQKIKMSENKGVRSNNIRG